MHTERLLLRQETEEMLAHIFQQNMADQLLHFGYEREEEIVLHKERLAKCKANALANCVQWDIIEKESNQVVGRAGFHNWYAAHEKAEIGYALYEKYHKKGYMLEATKKMVEYGFTQMKVNRIEAFIAPENLPSKNLIKNLGFTYEGLLRQHYKKDDQIYDSEVYSLLKEEYFQDGT